MTVSYERLARIVNKRKDILINTEIKATYLVAKADHATLLADTLEQYNNNTGILSFSEEKYDSTGSSVTVSVERNFQSEGGVSVQYGVFGSTVGTGGGILSWGSGDSSPKQIEIPIIDGPIIEGADALTLTLFHILDN